jgi:hypothetical protein
MFFFMALDLQEEREKGVSASCQSTQADAAARADNTCSRNFIRSFL